MSEVVDLSKKRRPVVYTVEITHHWDDTLEVFVSDVADDERSRASVADAMKRAAILFEAKTPEDLVRERDRYAAAAERIRQMNADWKVKRQLELEAAVAEFKSALPGWWYSFGECEVTCHASCAPTTQSPDIHRISQSGDQWDAGFHADLAQPSTLADALRDVMQQALGAKSAPTPPSPTSRT